jgi:hypothetical protein
MKLADLLDEHGLKLFKGADILFGILWGIFGALLVIENKIIANMIFAMCVAFIIRRRLDYLNHDIAVTLIFFSFFLYSEFTPKIFFVYYFVFLIFGSLRDYLGEKIKNKSQITAIYDNFMWYYPIPTFIFCLIYGNWIVFWSFLAYTCAYDLTKFLFELRSYK